MLQAIHVLVVHKPQKMMLTLKKLVTLSKNWNNNFTHEQGVLKVGAKKPHC